MNTYWGSGGIAVRILDFGTRWRWMVSFMIRPLYPQGKRPRCPLDRRLKSGPVSLFHHGFVFLYSFTLKVRSSEFFCFDPSLKHIRIPYTCFYFLKLFLWLHLTLKFDRVSVGKKNFLLYENLNSTTKSRDSSVGIELGYGLDDRGSRVQFPAGAGNFSLHYRIQNGSRAHPAFYPMGTRSSFPGGEAAGAWSWPLTFI
jgi:hypothetical protein